MKKGIVLTVASLAVVALVGSLLAAEFEIEIVVSPNVINIGSQSEVVTVHTDISYSSVAGAYVTLNGLEIDWWRSDNRGNFVAKFDATAVKGVVDPGTTAELVLSGCTRDGVEFSGTDEVKVINVIPRK